MYFQCRLCVCVCVRARRCIFRIIYICLCMPLEMGDAKSMRDREKKNTAIYSLNLYPLFFSLSVCMSSVYVRVCCGCCYLIYCLSAACWHSVVRHGSEWRQRMRTLVMKVDPEGCPLSLHARSSSDRMMHPPLSWSARPPNWHLYMSKVTVVHDHHATCWYKYGSL